MVDQDGVQSSEPNCVSTGVPGLDDVLHGGLPARRLHLVEGMPGTGKTTLAVQFLIEGVRRGERVLYVTLAETQQELAVVATSHGWSLDGIQLYELAPSVESLRPDKQYTILHPGEVELSETIWAVLEEVERSQPTRLVLDSLSELRLIANDPLRYRRQVLGLKQFFAGRSCTVLVLDNNDADSSIESIAHSVILLEQLLPEHGGARRRLRVLKMRGVDYRAGYHDFSIHRGGMRVYPRLVAAEHRDNGARLLVSSGLPALDALLGGGLHTGTSTLLIGPAGSGKSLVATQYLVAAAERGEPSALYLFDEGVETFMQRAEGLDLALRKHVDAGVVTIRQLDAAQVTPGEFDTLVRDAVEDQQARLVVIDSLNGYLNAMTEEKLMLLKLHELLAFLNARRVLTLMTIGQHGILGDRMQAPIDVSYLADNIILMRYFEAGGELRQAINVVKKRTGGHERSIREFRVSGGITLGEPLRDFRGIMLGVPEYVGGERALMADVPS